jgi:two-component system copper resistance phosphate regulon response regulator CusR
MKTERILVVDDDQEFAESIAMRCRGLGFEAETASSPLAAIAKIIAHPPDLLCLDVNLPTGNGLDLCEHVVRKSTAPQIPVIVMTGQTDRETILHSARLGTRYLHKSSDVWQRLRPLIEELLPSPVA